MKTKDAPAGVANIVDQAVWQMAATAMNVVATNASQKIYSEMITDELSSSQLP